MPHPFNKEVTAHIAAQLHSYGYTVYIAESGTYGFYTDGVRVVCFQADFSMVNFMGNYRPVNPNDGRSVGTGWQFSDGKELSNIDADMAKRFITADAPHWAIRGLPVKYVTPEQHMKMYGPSSRYSVFTPEPKEGE